MKKVSIIWWVRRWFRVEYRLAVFSGNDPKPENIYGRDRRLLLNMAKATGAAYWTLYKTGPLGIEEHTVTYGGYMVED